MTIIDPNTVHTSNPFTVGFTLRPGKDGSVIVTLNNFSSTVRGCMADEWAFTNIDDFMKWLGKQAENQIAAMRKVPKYD